MKYTLLDLTQTILSSMDSDEVNSITDSVEAQQVVKIIRTAYFDIIGFSDLSEHYSLVTLNASGTSTKPVLMTLPSTVSSIDWVKYDKHLADDPDILMGIVNPLPIENFLEVTYMLNESDTNVGSFLHSVGTDTFKILYRTDKAPDWYTTFDDYTVLFDSYDSTVDTTLQKNKTLCYGRTVIPFTEADTFVPDLDENQFALLLNEAKSLAWAELRQTSHAKAEKSASRGWVNLQKKDAAIKVNSPMDRLPNYGRK